MESPERTNGRAGQPLGIFTPDILGGEFDVEHGGANLGVSHQVHQGRQGDSSPRHVGSEGVAKAMGIGLGNFAAQAVMAKQRAQPVCSHGAAALAALQRHEQRGQVGPRSFQAQIVLQDLEGFCRQGQDALFVAFAEDAEVCIRQAEIFELKVEHLAGTHAIQQHEGDDGKIAKGAKATPETGDLVGGERNDHATGLPEAQTADDSALRTALAER